MTVVGSATFELLGDSSEFSAALARASAQLDEWGAETQEAANRAVSGLQDVEIVGRDIVNALEAVGAGGAEAAAGLTRIEHAADGVAPTVRALEDLEVAGLGIVHSMDAAGAAAVDAGQGFNKAGQNALDSGRKVKSFSDRMDEVGNKLESAGRRLTVAFTLPLLALGGLATKAAVDFESSFAGIRKTMDLTEAEFGKLAQANRDLAKTIPVSVNELNRIGELGGQLGIRGVENVLKFERTIAQLAVTTDLTADAAALGFAKIANILQLPQGQIDRLGATVVDLGNNFATVESQIVDFTQRIAGAGQLAGLSAGSVAGIGTALASLGVEAEAGGTAVQRVLLSMVSAAAQGGEELDVFAETAGLTRDEFVRAFREDAAGAFVAFVEGLGQQGDRAIATLEELGLTDQRVARAFLAAAGAGDLLRSAIERGNRAFNENTALVTEAEKRFQTFASQLTLTWNRLKDVAITLGNALLPVFRDALDAAEPLIGVLEGMSTVFASLGDGARTLVVGTAALVAGLGPFLVLVGAAAQGLTALAGAAALLNISLSAGALGLIAAGVGLVVGFALLARSGRQAAESMKALEDATKQAADQAAGYESKVQGMTAAMRDAERTRLDEALERQRATLVDLQAEWEELDRILKRQQGTPRDFVQAQQREPEILRDLEVQRSLVARLEAQYAALGVAIAAAVTQQGQLSGGGGGELAARIREIQQELAVGLATAGRLGVLLGDAFDPAAESADVLRAAIEGAAAANLSFETVLGPQGETLRELADLYLDTQAGVDAAAESVREMARATAEAEGITRSVLTPMEEWQDVAARLDDHLFNGRLTLETYLRALEQADEAFREAVGNTAEQVAQIEALAAAHKAGAEALKEYNREQFIQAELAKLAADATADEIRRTREAAGVVFDALNADADDAANNMARSFQRASQRISDAFVDMAFEGKFAIRDFVGDAIREFARLEAAAAAMDLFQFLKSGRGKGESFDLGGFLKDIGIAVGTAFLGGKISGRAHGGDVFASHPYLVGERGPELFVPRAAGSIVSNAALSGGGGLAGIDWSRFPPARNPAEGARDHDWQVFISESMDVARERGFR